jgi:hypothetical protein
MPILIPTPEEIAQMSWRQREKAKRRAAVALQAAKEADRQADAALDHLWDSTRNVADWAVAVRAEARRLYDLVGPDPEAELHRQQLREATS